MKMKHCAPNSRLHHAYLPVNEEYIYMTLKVYYNSNLQMQAAITFKTQHFPTKGRKKKKLEGILSFEGASLEGTWPQYRH